ncbi:unnamed protein product [Closterium sp. NIES-64]|nr:unnamed protein product [Closterium sp. NIES-64]
MNFEPVNAIERARDNLAALRQHRSVAEYVNRFRELVLEIPDIPASEQMDKFKRGLKPKIRTEVELRECTSMDDMIRVAERFDTINFAAFQRFNGMMGHTKHAPAACANGPTPMELGMMERQPRNASNVMCYQCGKIGHIKHPNSNLQDVIMADGTRRRCGPTLLPVHCMFGSLEAMVTFEKLHLEGSRAAANTTRLPRSDQHTSFSTPPNPAAATTSHHPPRL